MNTDLLDLKERYDTIAMTGDNTTTASDFHLRELEIQFGLKFMRDGDKVLDVGCGPGVALCEYVKQRNVDAYGIDYSDNMVEFAKSHVAEQGLSEDISFKTASVTELPFESDHFNIVTSHRCLMALLDWDKQKAAIEEIYRVLKPGAIYVMMEGTLDGIAKLNQYRKMFNLPEIDPDGRDRLYTKKFDEFELKQFCDDKFELLDDHRFGMYYFLTRIVQPLLVAPDSPSYDHPLNAVAKEIAKKVDFEGIGHLAGLAWRKRLNSSL